MRRISLDIKERRAQYMGKSPLQWYVDSMIERNCSHITLCAYDVSEDYQAYRRDRQLVDVRHAQERFEEMVSELPKTHGEGFEIGLCSTVLRHGMEEYHSLFMDCDNFETKDAGKFAPFCLVRSSEKGLHAYTNLIESHFGNVAADLLSDDLYKYVDRKWIRCGLQRGFNVLRLTNLTERFAGDRAPCVVSVP